MRDRPAMATQTHNTHLTLPLLELEASHIMIVRVSIGGGGRTPASLSIGKREGVRGSPGPDNLLGALRTLRGGGGALYVCMCIMVI